MTYRKERKSNESLLHGVSLLVLKEQIGNSNYCMSKMPPEGKVKVNFHIQIRQHIPSRHLHGLGPNLSLCNILILATLIILHIVISTVES